MEDPEQNAEAFGHMKTRLLEELTAYANYVEDACDYYTGLINNFSLGEKKENSIKKKNLPLKEKIILRKLDQISPHDKNFVLKKYKKMKKLEKNPLQAFVIWCNTIQLIFTEKQQIIRSLLPALQKTLETLEPHNIDSVFLSLLTTHGTYLKSRSDIFHTDPSPVFSIPGVHNNFHNQRKVAIEETKHRIIIDFLEELYPFTKDTDRRITKLLLYFPVLSKHLSAPQSNFLLDEFVLDGFIFGKYSKDKNIKNILSAEEVDRNIMKATTLPIIDIDRFHDIKDPTFAAEKIEWVSLYQNQFTKKFSTSRIFPENYLKGLEVSFKKKAKKKKKRPSHRKNIHLTQKEEVPTESIAQSRIIAPPIIPPSDTKTDQEDFLLEQISTNPLIFSQPIIEKLPNESKNEQELLSLEPPPTISPEEFLFDPMQKQPPVKDLEASQEEKETKDNFAQRKEELKRRAKIERDFHKEKRRNPPERSEQPPLGSTHHPLLPDTTRFKVKGEKHHLLTLLLRGTLPPTTSYNKTVVSLNRLGVTFLARGNGDKRIMLMPNGRKELVFYPATSEAGHRFFEKIRKALQEKWGLKEEYLY
jgi:hypothetical protein